MTEQQSALPGANEQLARLADWSRATTLFGYFGLLVLLTSWTLWLAPPAENVRAFKLIALVVPMLFPLRGLLHARPYTHAWMTFLALPYFVLGVGEVFATEAELLLGALQVLFSVMWFVGAMLFARYGGRLEKARALKNE